MCNETAEFAVQLHVNSGLTNTVYRPHSTTFVWLQISTKINVSKDPLESVTEAELATKPHKLTSHFGSMCLVAPFFQKGSNN